MEDQESRQTSAEKHSPVSPLAETPGGESPASDSQPERSPRSRRRWVLIALLILPLLCCAGYWLVSRIAVDAAAQVDELRGLVDVQRKGALAWNPAQLNQLLWGKDWVRTGQGSSARLRFFDVSTADVHEGTEVLVEKAAQSRDGRSGNVILKNWVGTTSVRAVRLMDASSSFQVDTPTASTVVRGARFTVQVDQDGETQIDVHTGSAQVDVGQETLTLRSGERVTVQTGGAYQRERVYEPNAELLTARIKNAWDAPGETYHVELPEDEINQFLAALSAQSGFPVRDPQVWLIEDQARVFATLNEPAELDVGASLEIEVVDGKLKPQIELAAGGMPLPLPGPVLDLAVQTVLDDVQGYLDQVQGFVEFSEVQIQDGSIVVTGKKRPGATDAQ